MGRPSKFSEKEKADIFLYIKRYLEHIDEKTTRLTVSDSEMSNILCTKGYDINTKYIERLRQRSKILPCGETGGVRPGSGRPPGSGPMKFDQATMNIIQVMIKDHTDEFWKLTISDHRMSEIVCDSGYIVNVKYIERMRQKMGVKPQDKTGGDREGAGRPLSGSTQDLQYAGMIELHNIAVAQLSYRRPISGALRGQSGTDAHDDRFGYHATNFDDAVVRKQKEVTRQKKYILWSEPVLPSSEDINNGSGLRVNRLNQKAYTDISSTEQSESASIFIDQVNRRAETYGKVGKAGSTQNTKTSQVLSSM